MAHANLCCNVSLLVYRLLVLFCVAACCCYYGYDYYDYCDYYDYDDNDDYFFTLGSKHAWG